MHRVAKLHPLLRDQIGPRAQESGIRAGQDCSRQGLEIRSSESSTIIVIARSQELRDSESATAFIQRTHLGTCRAFLRSIPTFYPSAISMA